jgi:bleomycin hydrolase
MKKLVLSLLLVGASATSFGQAFGYSEPVQNAEGSNYQLTKIAHLDATPVQSQGYTGTCWSFSALSFFESELMRKGNKNPDILSEMFVVRKAYESKAQKYIRMDGKINFSEGGAFHDIPYVIRNYGIVPEEIYKGLNYGSEKHDHSELFSVLNGAVQGVLSHVTGSGDGVSTAWMNAVNGILDAYLGKDVKEFELKGKKYTPQSYAKAIGLNMDEYVSLTSFTNHPMYQRCMLEIPDNWAWGESYNVGLTDLFDACDYALKNGYTLAWGADVSEKGFSFKNGLAIVPEDPSTIDVQGRDNKNFSDAGADKSSNAFLSPQKELTITPELRQQAYDGKVTTDDHGMHIVGLYKDQNGTRYLLVKNSWGTGNYPKGFLYVSENYFKYKTINIYLHKDGVAPALRKKLGI